MRRRIAISVLMLALGLLLGGCHKPLFPRKAPRTQFETYDLMRRRYQPLEEPDTEWPFVLAFFDVMIRAA